jgi:hypothetical protein
MIADMSKREKECFTFLNLIPREKRYVVIGGYAVSSFGFPRFSVDLDIVIHEKELTFFKKLISERNFDFKVGKNDLLYSGRFERYEKDLVSIDLLINGVQSRQTGYFYSFEYILKNSQIQEVSGWDTSSKTKVRIANREILIAMKIHSMRMADKRDIVMLCYKKPNIENIVNHLSKCPKEKIISNLNELTSDFNDKNFKDSLKGVYSINDTTYTKAIENCKQTTLEVKNSL